MAENVFIIEDDQNPGAKYTFRLSGGKLLLEPYGAQPDVPGHGILVSMNWPSVHELSDGQDVSAATFNKPITELSERTTYLYDKLRTFNRNNPLATMSVSDARLCSSDSPEVGDFVYLDSASGEFMKAVATEDIWDSFTLAESAYASGVLVKKEGSKGTVVLAGRLDMTLSGLSVDRMLESGEKFRPGVYFLSSSEPGRMTAFPQGPRILLGKFTGGDLAYIQIHAKDFGDSHVHRSYLLTGAPAGEQTLDIDGPGGIHRFVGHSPDHFAARSESNEHVYPRLVFTGEWLLDKDDVAYDFELQSFGGSTPPDLKFSDNDSGVWLAWRRAGKSGRVQFTEFDKPVALDDDSGVCVSLQSGSQDALDADTIYDYIPSDAERQWTSMKFPDVAKGWRSLTRTEVDRYRKLHKNITDDRLPKFVYNIGFDRNMQAYYPPVPMKSASIVMNGVELASDRLGGDFVYSIENDSIYWFDNSWDHAPWPTNYVSRYVIPEAWERRRIVLHFIRSSSTETGPVTSLRGAPGSGVRVVSCGSGDESDVGDLMIDIDPLGDVVDDNLPGYRVVKAGGNGVFKTGPVVERVVAGSGITLSRLGGSPAGQGTVVINAVNSGISGDFDDVALQNAKQDMAGLFPYIRLLGWTEGQQNTPSAFILKFHVPYSNSDDLYTVHMSMSVFGTQGYVDSATRKAGVTIDYSVLPDYSTGDKVSVPSNLKEGLIVPDNSRTVEIPLASSSDGGIVSYNAFDTVTIDTDDGSDQVFAKKYHALGKSIPDIKECGKYVKDYGIDVLGVKPGYTVAVRVARCAVSSGTKAYTAAIGFVNMGWKIERIV